MYPSEMAAGLIKARTYDEYLNGTLRVLRGTDSFSNSAYNITSLRAYAFHYQTNLVYVSLPFLSYIGSYAFSYCTYLKSIYLMSTTLCTLAHSNAFTSCTALTSIYVPSHLLTSYKAATNWTYFSTKMYSTTLTG